MEIDSANLLIVVGEGAAPMFQIEWSKEHPEIGPVLIRNLKTGETTEKPR